MANATKVSDELLAWTAIPDLVTDTPSMTSGSLDIGEGAVGVILNIGVAHTDVNAAGAAYVTIKVEVLIDGRWEYLTSFQAGGGTAVAEALDAESASAQPNIKVAATTDWDDGLLTRLFLLDTTLANSEVVEIKGWADADYYIAMNNLEITHAHTTSILYDGLVETPVSIPDGIRYVSVNASNNDDDANYALHVSYSAVSEYV